MQHFNLILRYLAVSTVFILNLFFCQHTTRLLHHECGMAWGGCVGVCRHRQQGLTQTCFSPHTHRETHTYTCKLFKAPDGDRAPNSQEEKEFSSHEVLNVVLFFCYPVKSINLMLFIWEKQITGFHQQLCVSASMCSALSFSLRFPLPVLSWLQTPATAKVSVCVCVCKVTTVICIMGFVVPKTDENRY